MDINFYIDQVPARVDSNGNIHYASANYDFILDSIKNITKENPKILKTVTNYSRAASVFYLVSKRIDNFDNAAYYSFYFYTLDYQKNGSLESIANRTTMFINRILSFGSS